MHAFERVNRATQRLCSGYSSFPGLVEWGKLNASRLQAVDFNDHNGTNSFSRLGAMTAGSTHDEQHGPLAKLKHLQARPQTQYEPRERKYAARLRQPFNGRISTNWGENGNDSLLAALPFPSASASSLPGRGFSLPSWNPSFTDWSNQNQLLHRTKEGSDVEADEKIISRRKRNGNKYSRSNGGVLSAAKSGQTGAGLACGSEGLTRKTREHLDTGLSTASNMNSVAQLLREDRAHRQRIGSSLLG